ncbi:MAG: carbamate kinase [Candidatus Bathyarchaeia archaeon]
MGKRVVIALGGNAIKQPEEKGTVEEQFRNVDIACTQIASIVRKGYDIVITHGNGPQVGNLAIQQEQSKQIVPPQPLVVLGAMTQGQIGYMIQQSLRNQLKDLNKNIVTIITQVIVDKDDPDFLDPHKPVGPFYTEDEVKKLMAEKGWIIRKVRDHEERPWRRVVPSPEPLGIVEGKVVKHLIDLGAIVIASGGGGIPVLLDENGSLRGVDAVIDKDKAGEVLAEAVEADIFLILTDVDCVKLNMGKPEEKNLREIKSFMARAYLKEGHFPPGSMGPKVEACIRFVEHGGEKAIITSLDKGLEALEGKAGTVISRS